MIILRICSAMFISLSLYIVFDLFRKYIHPMIISKSIKEIEKNPKWITSKGNYYGLQDVDIILAETNYGTLPYFRVTKDNQLQLLISTDTPARDESEIVRLALLGKIYIKYGVWYPDKPVHWLSVLCYMLDGGDIKEAVTKFEEKQETS